MKSRDNSGFLAQSYLNNLRAFVSRLNIDQLGPNQTVAGEDRKVNNESRTSVNQSKTFISMIRLVFHHVWLVLRKEDLYTQVEISMSEFLTLSA